MCITSSNLTNTYITQAKMLRSPRASRVLERFSPLNLARRISASASERLLRYWLLTHSESEEQVSQKHEDNAGFGVTIYDAIAYLMLFVQGSRVDHLAGSRGDVFVCDCRSGRRCQSAVYTNYNARKNYSYSRWVLLWNVSLLYEYSVLLAKAT